MAMAARLGINRLAGHNRAKNHAKCGAIALQDDQCRGLEGRGCALAQEERIREKWDAGVFTRFFKWQRRNASKQIPAWLIEQPQETKLFYLPSDVLPVGLDEYPHCDLKAHRGANEPACSPQAMQSKLAHKKIHYAA